MYRSLWTSRAEDPLRGACALAGRPLRLHQGGACTARARMAPVARATRTGDRPRRVPFLVFLLRFGRDFLSYLSFPTLSVREQETSDTNRDESEGRQTTPGRTGRGTSPRHDPPAHTARGVAVGCALGPAAHRDRGAIGRSDGLSALRLPSASASAHRTLLRIPALSQMLMRSPPRTRGRCSRLLSNSTSSPSAPRAATQPQHE